MLVTINIIINIIIFFLSYEAIMWGWTLNRHAVWIETHVKERRTNVSNRILKISTSIYSIFSFVLWACWIFIMATTPTHGYHILCALIISTIQLTIIHFSVIISRYSCLPRSFWPIVSKYVSIILCKYTNIPEPILNSEDLHICWGESYEK